MIFLVGTFLAFLLIALLIQVKNVLLFLLKNKFSKRGLSITYFLQARWELFNLQTELQIATIKKREEKEMALTQVEEVVHEDPKEVDTSEKVKISLDKFPERVSLEWEVHYFLSKKKPRWSTKKIAAN